MRCALFKRQHLLVACFFLAIFSLYSQLQNSLPCTDPHVTSKDMLRRSMEGHVRARRCGNHKRSTTFINSYNVSSVFLGGNSGHAYYAGPDVCEYRCESDTKCKGWTYNAISQHLGYCSKFTNLNQGHPNDKFTSGVCAQVRDTVQRTTSWASSADVFKDLGYIGHPATDDAAQHVVMIFDEARIDYAVGFLKSLQHFSGSASKGPSADHAAHTATIILHLVVPASLLPVLQASVHLASAHVFFYDFAVCEDLIRPVRSFAPHLHAAPMCKVFMADLLPDAVDRVLFVDNDCVSIADATPCFPQFDGDELLGMTFDAGEACQADPDKCWPMSHEWVVTDGLVCGTTARRATRLRQQGRAHTCASAGEREPVQFNAGVVYYNLQRMREVRFTERLVNLTWHTARNVGPDKRADWGDQEFLANYLRFYPEALKLLPCGCNYQWTAPRRSIKCPGQPVYIGHGWSAGTAEQTKDPYNKLFFHFKLCESVADCSTPPITPWMLRSVKDTASPEYPIEILPTRKCPHQSWDCNEDLTQPIFVRDTVHVLTRTAARPNFFKEARLSVLAQSHRHVQHLVLTDDPASMAYIEGSQVIEVPSKYSAFDAMEPCDRCGASPDRGCGNAPYDPTKRNKFLDCYCSTSYPMNEYMEALHSQVKDGWVVYLDDDNMFLDPHGLASALVHAHSHSDLVLWKAKLGRIVPKPEHWGTSAVVRGDCDSANFMFHSEHISSTRWGNTRCGDFRTISALSNLLHMRWLNRVVIAANPMRLALGGLGLRGEFNSKVTVVVTSCTKDGFRPFWLKTTTNQYLSEAYETVIHRVILVWNAPDLEPPEDLQESSRLVILRMKVNSLNNRWTKILEHVQTEAVLNLDDDVFVTKPGIICLMNWWSLHQDRLVGPFVRKNDGNKYVIDELFGHTYYTLMLPRVILLSRKHLMTYRNIKREIRQYVDDQSAHCDDIVMNVGVAHATKKPPFRVLLPEATIIDYYSTCWQSFKQDTAGLGLQDKRAHYRSICMEWILQRFDDDVLQASSDVGACDFLGARLRPQDSHSDKKEAWLNMTQKPDLMLCSKGAEE